MTGLSGCGAASQAAASRLIGTLGFARRLDAALQKIADERGSSLVEFSLVAFMLLMVIFGVVEISRMVLVYTDVANAAREGTRYVSVHGSESTSDIQNVVKNALKVAPIDPARATVTPSITNTPGQPSTITITVAYQYDPFTTYFPLNVTLSSKSEGVIVY
ncbi:MAG TPA: TadE/TadG family type IV pilus assembly protein [Bryobacteraceae bacterium]|jgi:Flp pilus assembly protein TadG|nr:TadE/TadG family type IV pilus assembly protein [Bryobacteraceae bacterium]